jgi:hypothetical protein
VARQDTKLESEGAEFIALGLLLTEGIRCFKAYTNFAGYDLVAMNLATSAAPPNPPPHQSASGIVRLVRTPDEDARGFGRFYPAAAEAPEWERAAPSRQLPGYPTTRVTGFAGSLSSHFGIIAQLRPDGPATRQARCTKLNERCASRRGRCDARLGAQDAGDRTLSRARCGQCQPPCRLEDPTAPQAPHTTQQNCCYRACRSAPPPLSPDGLCGSRMAASLNSVLRKRRMLRPR